MASTSNIVPYVIRIDDTGLGVIYIGRAYPGYSNNTDLPVWQIKEESDNGAGQQEIRFADGDEYFDNVWDKRAALAYS